MSPNTQKPTTSITLAGVLPALALLCALPAGAALTTTTFNGSVWPRTDAAIGVTGFVIESFENLTLAPGLRIGLVSSPLSSTLPATFNPATDDSAGNVFVGGVWDGSNVLLNQAANDVPACGYNCGGWGDILIEIAAGTTSVGFSVQQLDGSLSLFANGSATAFATLSLGTAGSFRNGYVRIDATGGDTIQTLLLRSTIAGDGYTLDYLAFAPNVDPVPEPRSTALVLSALVLYTMRNKFRPDRR
jgi:hypothetical protein